MSPLLLRIGSYVICAVICFAVGWRVKSAFIAERDLAIVEARDAMIAEYRVNEAGKALILENKLAELRANEKVINNEIIKIVDRPVYHNVCLDTDGLRLIEAARAGKSNTTKSTDEVP